MWGRVQRGVFFSMWLHYAKAWAATLKRWEQDDFTSGGVRPAAAYPAGLYWWVVEGQTIVGDKQLELTGQSMMHGSRGMVTSK